MTGHLKTGTTESDHVRETAETLENQPASLRRKIRENWTLEYLFNTNKNVYLSDGRKKVWLFSPTVELTRNTNIYKNIKSPKKEKLDNIMAILKKIQLSYST